MKKEHIFLEGDLVRFAGDKEYLSGIGLVLDIDPERKMYFVRWMSKRQNNYYDMWMKITELEKVTGGDEFEEE